MASQPVPPPEPAATKKRLVNRNAHLAAASKIVAILEGVDPSKWVGVLNIVRDSLQIQNETPLFKEEAPK